MIVRTDAQTLTEARRLFSNEEYERAKPAFRRFVKQSPNNANYNYWYGVCCVQTGEPQAAISPLELALKRKVPHAARYLAQACEQLYDFDAAVAHYETAIAEQEKKKQPTDELVLLAEHCKRKARMIKGVEEVCFVDSFLTDKQSFLRTYRLSEESGRLYTYGEYFDTVDSLSRTVYETELGNKLYYSDLSSDTTLSIYTKNKQLGTWGAGTLLPDVINADGNVDYPYVLTDGQTIYYAADGEQSIGGYDIFVTRYNAATDSYLTPENLGMPFNSEANDYMYVIDEYNNLGWFATDRRQSPDSVCVYVFIPNPSRKSYSYEATERTKLAALAQLTSIRATWTDEALLADARSRLEGIATYEPMRAGQRYDFTFVVDDAHTYHADTDFRSADARGLFARYRQEQAACEQLRQRLSQRRDAYAEAPASEHEAMRTEILEAEQQLRRMEPSIKELARTIRNTEIKQIQSTH
jgi:tetratricopeptide (TPR) repeat protein